MNLIDEEFSLQKLQSFLEQQRNILDSDRTSLRYFQAPVRGHSVISQDKDLLSDSCVKGKCISSHSISSCNNDTKEKMMKSDKPNRRTINSRDSEKEKLISALSVPKKRHSCSSIKVTNKNNSSQRHSNSSFTATDAREQEKDRLAAIFASSGYQFSKPSNQTSKNLNSDICFEENKQVIINKAETSKIKNVTDDQMNSRTKNVLSTSKYEFKNQPVEIPKILISECDQRSLSNTDNSYQESPRRFLDSQHHPTPNRQLKDAITQTEWDDETTIDKNCNISERRFDTLAHEEVNCISPSLRFSFNPKCFEGLNEKEIKEHLYREDLRRQIEEKNKLKEEMKQREAEEDAKLELRIQQDQEKMRRQYEEERLQRLQLAIKRKEQEELLQQRLALEKQKTVQENMAQKHEILNKKNTSSNDSRTKNYPKSSESAYLSGSSLTQTNFPSKILVDARDELRQPLLELQTHELSEEVFKHYPPKRDVPSRKVDNLQLSRKSLRDNKSPQIFESEKGSIHALNASSHCNRTNVLQQSLNEPSSCTIRHQTKEAHRLLKEPLLPPETYPDLPPMSPPLLHATIPPLTASLHPTMDPSRPPSALSPRLHRTNSEILEDRWKVPYVERYNAAPSDVFTEHKHSVLTQLGAFRRHLQQERLRMQQRVQDESL